MPVALLRAYSAMLPRLQAEEQLASIEAVAVGAGRVEAKATVQCISALERAALGGRRVPAARPTPDQLAAIGVGVRMVEAYSRCSSKR